MTGSDRLIRAVVFATRAHRADRRKDAAATPYINHPIEVMGELAAAGYDDPQLLAAAVLHDTLEDTTTTFEDLEDAFGLGVASMVSWVTDDKALAWHVRKAKQREEAHLLPPDAKRIRIADKICNIRDCILSPPIKWPDDRRQDYVTWAKSVVEACKCLETAAIYERYRAVLREL